MAQDPDSRPEGVAELVQELMRQAGVTAAQLAREAGVSPSVISRLTRGEVAVRLDTLARIADALERRGVEDAAERLLPATGVELRPPSVAVYVWLADPIATFFSESENVQALEDLANRDGTAHRRYVYIAAAADSGAAATLEENGFTVCRARNETECLVKLTVDLAEAFLPLENGLDTAILVAPPPELEPWVRYLKRNGKTVIIAAPPEIEMPISLIAAAGRHEKVVAHEPTPFDRQVEAVVKYLAEEPGPPRGRSFRWLVDELRDKHVLRPATGHITEEEISRLVSTMIMLKILYQTDFAPGRLRTVGLNYENPRVTRIISGRSSQ